MKRKTIFIFAYYSYKDPVFQSAVLPYFKGLNQEDEKFRFVLLTFEQKQYAIGNKQYQEIKKQLAEEEIIWYRTNWHSGRFKFIKKVFDFLYGMLLAAFLMIKYSASAIYSEGFPGSVIAYFLSRTLRRPLIVHTYEPHTQYMVESEVWSETSWEAVCLAYFEKRIGLKAEYILTATQTMVNELKEKGARGKLYRVPSCVDTHYFRFDQESRLKVRQNLGVAENEVLICYLGKFGGMYMDHEIFDFFACCQNYNGIKFKFLILTPDSHDEVQSYMKKAHLNPDDVHLFTVTRDQVPDYLSASDFGFVPVKQYPGKKYCSPIKDGEYWACGLPLLIFEGISDDYLFTREHNLGYVIKSPTQEDYLSAINKIEGWHSNKEEQERIKARCLEFVERDRSIKSFQNIYRQIFSQL